MRTTKPFQWLVFAFLLCLLSPTAWAEQTAAEETEGIDFELSGYYRVRYNYINNINLDADTGPNNTGYIRHRLRLEPAVWFGPNLGFFNQLHVFDDVMYGYNYWSAGGYSPDNKYEPPVDLFASGESNTTPQNRERDSVVWERAWIEWLTPVGIFQIGRQASNFAMGIFSHNGGNALGLFRKGLTAEEKYEKYFGSPFGDWHSGSTYDQVIFATQPLAPMGIEELVMALQYTKLIEIGSAQSDKNYGIHDASDDADEYLLALYWDGKKNEHGNWTEGGFYIEERASALTETAVYILDYHFKTSYYGFYFQDEGVVVRGGSNNQGITFTTKAAAEIFLNIARLGYADETMDLRLEVGYVPGDKYLYNNDPFLIANGQTLPTPYTVDNDGDGLMDIDPATGKNAMQYDGKQKVTTFYLLQDYKVGLILFPEVMNYFYTGWLDISGGVMNATYIYPTADVRLLDRKLRLIGGILWAQSNEPAQYRGMLDDETELGLEFDFRLDYTIWDRIHVGFETGYLLPGKGIPGYWAGYDTDPEAVNPQVKDPDPVFLIRGRFTVVW